ncbi:hypothetical protein H2203_008886 [Taxawa tesnikishii (nom. ined.)]|nr:hypothetical protein H2203_008886 [Dothideales sp. JES 119]
MPVTNQGIESTIYELRTDDVTSAGAIMLSPNALRSLDAIGIYTRIKDKGYHFRDLTFRDDEQKFLDAYEMGNADKFGYDALRVYRQVILDAHKAAVAEADIDIVYSKRFSHIVSETEDGVTFAFTDGSQQTVDLLIGADGIHSSVRKYLDPDTEPAFSNVMAITCALPTSAVNFPSEPYQMPVSVHGKAGAFVMAPQNPEGSELLGGIQYRTHVRDRAGWDALWNDKPLLLSMMREQYDEWNPMVQSAIDVVRPEGLSIWAFHTVPKLASWKSSRGRVVLLGDAAHAIPPAAGQGVNQAFEDAHSLALLLAEMNEGKVALKHGLDRWQMYRQARVDRVSHLTNEMNKRRLPGWTGEGAETIDSSWLFGVQIADDVRQLVDAR